MQISTLSPRKEKLKNPHKQKLQLGENNFQEIVALQPSWRYETDTSIDMSCATWFWLRETN